MGLEARPKLPHATLGHDDNSTKILGDPYSKRTLIKDINIGFVNEKIGAKKDLYHYNFIFFNSH